MLKKPGVNYTLSSLTFLFIVLFIAQSTLSYSSPLSSRGGVDTHTYKTDTVIFESTALDDASPTLSEGASSVGLSMFHSPYMSLFYIPLKYGLNDYLQISFSLPFVTKTLVNNNNHYIKSGYGDTMIGLTVFFDHLKTISSGTTIRVTLPTGDVNAQDTGILIPMGYGNYTASLQQSISFDELQVNFFKIRFFLNGLGVYYFDSSVDINTTTKYNYDKTYMWSAMAGADFIFIENLDVELKVNYIDIKERRYKTQPAAGANGWTKANDSVKQINVLPFIKYSFYNDITAQLGIIYPVKTIQDKTLTKTYESQWKIAMGIEKRFNGSSSAEENKKSTDKRAKKRN